MSQTPQGETKVYQGGTLGSVEKGKSYCALGCQPDAKPESYESLDLNPEGNFVALSLNRTDGNMSTEYGFQKSFSAFHGKLALRFAATRSAAGADILDSWAVRTMTPTSIRKKAKAWVGDTKPAFIPKPFAPKTLGQNIFDPWENRERQQKIAEALAHFQTRTLKGAVDKNLELSKAFKSLNAKSTPVAKYSYFPDRRRVRIQFVDNRLVLARRGGD